MRRRTGIAFVTMCETLFDAALGGRLNWSPVLQHLVDNYLASWDDCRQFDGEHIRQILGSGGIAEHVHYQAIMRILLADPDAARDTIDRATDLICEAHSPEPASLRARLDPAVEYQRAIVEALASLVRGGPRTVKTTLSSAELQQRSQLDVPAAAGSGAHLRLRIRAELSGTPFDSFILAVYHGSIDSLRLFEALESAGASQAVPPPPPSYSTTDEP